MAGRFTWACLGLAVGLVLYRYRVDPAAPGVRFAEGWWGWFDQGKTLASSLALMRGDLDPAQHWYPLGYSVLGAPLTLITHDHAFLPLNLVSLVALFLAACAVGRRLGLPSAVAGAAIAFGLAGETVLQQGWAVPWNTAPAASLSWILIACCLRQVEGRPRGAAIGACVAGVAACRPSDVALLLPGLALTAWACRAQPRSWRILGGALLGAALIAIPYAVLHLAIYGPAPSPYMRISDRLGFTATDFPWRAYVLLIDPTLWFDDGAGLLQRWPWVLPGLAALPVALSWGWAGRLLAVTLAAHLALYLSYVDLLPTGLWRYSNVHYFFWAMPGYALLGTRLILALARPGERRRAAASLAATLLLSAVRLDPVPLRPGVPAKMVALTGPAPPALPTYFSESVAADDVGPLPGLSAMRLIPEPSGVRLIGLRRRIVGPVRWPDGGPPMVAALEQTAAYGISIRLGWPGWLRRVQTHSAMP